MPRGEPFRRESAFTFDCLGMKIPSSALSPVGVSSFIWALTYEDLFSKLLLPETYVWVLVVYKTSSSIYTEFWTHLHNFKCETTAYKLHDIFSFNCHVQGWDKKQIP